MKKSPLHALTITVWLMPVLVLAQESSPLSALPVFVTVLFGIGSLVSFIAGIWFLVEAFKENIWWGVACLVFGPASLVFLFMHWESAKSPFLLNLLGVLIMAGGLIIAIQQGPENRPNWSAMAAGEADETSDSGGRKAQLRRSAGDGEVVDGMTPQEVINQLGLPVGQLEQGETTVYLYSDSREVRFENGGVISVSD